MCSTFGNDPNRGNAGPINIKFPSFIPIDQLVSYINNLNLLLLYYLTN